MCLSKSGGDLKAAVKSDRSRRAKKGMFLPLRMTKSKTNPGSKPTTRSAIKSNRRKAPTFLERMKAQTNDINLRL